MLALWVIFKNKIFITIHEVLKTAINIQELPWGRKRAYYSKEIERDKIWEGSKILKRTNRND